MLPSYPTLPTPHAALARLEAVGALDTGKCLTGLGAHLAALPMDAHIAKMLVYACLLHTVSPVLTIAAAMAYGRPMFSAPSDKRTEVIHEGKNTFSDHYMFSTCTCITTGGCCQVCTFGLFH